MSRENVPERDPTAAPDEGRPADAVSDEDVVFVIRLWLERQGLAAEGGHWRGHLRHRGGITRFVGLEMLFSYVSSTLEAIAMAKRSRDGG